jgi:hypothetical protein
VSGIWNVSIWAKRCIAAQREGPPGVGALCQAGVSNKHGKCEGRSKRHCHAAKAAGASFGVLNDSNGPRSLLVSSYVNGMQ